MSCPRCGFPVLLLGPDPALLKRHWTDGAKRRVQSFVIVKSEPVDHLIHGRSLGGKPPAVQPANLQAAPQTLRWGMVPAAALAAHWGLHLVALKRLREIMAAALATARNDMKPSLGLVPIIIKDIFKALAQIRKEGVTILLVEQNVRMALKLADRGYVLEVGRVALEGKAQDLLHSPDIQAAYLGGERVTAAPAQT